MGGMGSQWVIKHDDLPGGACVFIKTESDNARALFVRSRQWPTTCHIDFNQPFKRTARQLHKCKRCRSRSGAFSCTGNEPYGQSSWMTIRGPLPRSYRGWRVPPEGETMPHPGRRIDWDVCWPCNLSRSVSNDPPPYANTASVPDLVKCRRRRANAHATPGYCIFTL